MTTRPRWRILAVVACLVFAPCIGTAQTVVVPNSLTTTEGNTNNIWPFNCGSHPLPSQRYQQVYLGTEVGSGLIGEIRFRQDATLHAAFSSTLLGVTITLSTTTKAVDALSPTFAANVGVDVTTVFNGNLSLSGPDCSTSPCPFDIVIPLTTPFPFDGSAGNLLLDVTIPTCQNFGYEMYFDAHGDAADSISRTFTFGVDASSEDADRADSVGLVTLFAFGTVPVPVPAPTLSTWGMAAAIATLLTLGLLTLRRRSRV